MKNSNVKVNRSMSPIFHEYNLVTPGFRFLGRKKRRRHLESFMPSGCKYGAASYLAASQNAQLSRSGCAKLMWCITWYGCPTELLLLWPQDLLPFGEFNWILGHDIWLRNMSIMTFRHTLDLEYYSNKLFALQTRSILIGLFITEFLKFVT